MGIRRENFLRGRGVLLRWITSALALGLLGQGAGAAIYGSDDRKDIYEVPWLAGIARSVAAAVPAQFLQKEKDGTYTVTDSGTLEEWGGFCSDERFIEQPSAGMCSGFLIGDRYLVTAGHCALPNGIIDNEVHPFCESFSWYFDYNLKAPGQFPLKGISPDQIYGCKRVIRAENLQIGKLPGNDFALIELDRPVVSSIHPLPLAVQPVHAGDHVYTIGHPAGLPAKFSDMAPVLKIDQPYYFSVNLDTVGGNSGGAVFNAQGEVAGILVSGHQIDFTKDPKGCLRVNACDSNGRHCLEDSVLDQVSNYVQNIRTVLRYLPVQSVSL
jgi:V8-like Glu-specific endopeptidase